MLCHVRSGPAAKTISVRTSATCCSDGKSDSAAQTAYGSARRSSVKRFLCGSHPLFRKTTCSPRPSRAPRKAGPKQMTQSVAPQNSPWMPIMVTPRSAGNCWIFSKPSRHAAGIRSRALFKAGRALRLTNPNRWPGPLAMNRQLSAKTGQGRRRGCLASKRSSRFPRAASKPG